MNKTLTTLDQKKQLLDEHRPLPDELVKNLNDWFRVELTFTSNAIEGNTLSRAETALVVEKGLTVEGKTLREHLEADNHAQAFDWVVQQVSEKSTWKSVEHKKISQHSQPRPHITQDTILKLHQLILQKIDDDHAGRYRTVPVRIAGSRVVLPNPVKVPGLMKQFISWLNQAEGHPVKVSAEAHYRLVSIHPFVDGNGRTARLLMNLILMQAGYPPAIIRPEERRQYINSLEQAQLGGSTEDYYQLVYLAVERSLDIYLESLAKTADEVGSSSISLADSQADSKSSPEKLLKIGQLAELCNETVPTIRYWTKLGLLDVADFTQGGYQLFHPDQVLRVKKIRQLQKEKRLTLEEIKQEIGRG
jgi:Fic family protein